MLQARDAACADPGRWGDALVLAPAGWRSFLWLEGGVPRPACPERGERALGGAMR